MPGRLAVDTIPFSHYLRVFPRQTPVPGTGGKNSKPSPLVGILKEPAIVVKQGQMVTS